MQAHTDSSFLSLDRIWSVQERMRTFETVVRSACLHAVLPFTIAAAVLYPQFDPTLIRIGSYFHYSSVIVAFIAAVLTAKHLSTRVALFCSFLGAFLLSMFLGIRLPYLILLMLVFLLAGMALARFEKSWLFTAVLGIGLVSLLAMMFQVYGWPSWINFLATHGAIWDGDRVISELQTTILVPARELKAVYWQTRPSGVFASNQTNTLFFFVLFAVGMAAVKRSRLGFLIVALLAVYCVLTLAKTALLGTIAITTVLILVDQGGNRWKSVTYLGSLLAALLTYYALFPGIIETFLSPYVLLVSAMARLVDLQAAIGLQSSADILLSMSGEGVLAHAAADTAKAYANEFGSIDYEKLGSTSLYSAMARQPALSLVLMTSALTAAFALNLRRFGGISFGGFECMILTGTLLFTVTADVSTQQAFWFFAGFGLVSVYGGLIKEKPAGLPEDT